MRFIHTVDQIHDDGHMGQAAFGISVRVAEILHSATGHVVGSKVLLLVGPGNNGGDALWAGAFLAQRGVHVRAICTSFRVHEIASAKFAAAGGRFMSHDEIDNLAPHVILDGIFGAGFRDALSEDIRLVIAQTSDVGIVVAIDVPTGVQSDTGLTDPGCVHADVTLTIGTLKPGILTGQGKSVSGVIDVLPLDFTYPVTDAFVLDYLDIAHCYGPAPILSHKYTRGVVMINAGSSKYPGAGVLAVGGARASGIGMVRFAGEHVANVLQAYPDVIASNDLTKSNAIVVGSGESGTLEQLVEYLATDLPVVIDAHALTFLSNPEIQTALSERHQRRVSTVLTPHEGEAAHLGFKEPNRIAQAQSIARVFNSLVVLKGAGTVIADPTGAYAIDLFGTSALATAGSGDVLAGLIAGTLARSVVAEAPLHFVACAVALHGLAGRRAGNGCTATTLIEALVEVHSELADTRE
jgi:ADP-dependent NAD(P)H-hydrate dehydratase / NAD(P)H-hydrate epimerase